MKEGQYGAQVDLPNQPRLLVVTHVGRLTGFAVYLLVIRLLHPRRQQAVQLLQREDRTCERPNFAA